MALYQATTQQVEELTNTTGTGYPSIDRPWLSYYSKEAIEDPLMRQIRYLDKLVDELAKGKAMEKILRK